MTAYAPGRLNDWLVPREAGADADAEAEAAVVDPDLELLLSLLPPSDEGWDAAVTADDDDDDVGASSEGQEDGPSPLAGSFWSMRQC